MEGDPHIYEASDYAGIDVPSRGIKLYYGYEEQDRDEHWCFRATSLTGQVTIPFPALKLTNKELNEFEVVPCLMAGIAALIERGELTWINPIPR